MVKRKYREKGEIPRVAGPPAGSRWRRRSCGTLHELLGVVSKPGGPLVCVLKSEKDGRIMRAMLRGGSSWRGFQQRFVAVEG